MDILPVIVLYNCALEESETYRTLGPQLRDRKVGPVVVYDNSSESCPLPYDPNLTFIHHHDAGNGGIAAAYNFALRIAVDRRIGWLLLLDQDSKFPDDYLTAVDQAICEYASTSSVIAAVPRAWWKNQLFSPNQVRYGRHTPLHRDLEGVCEHEITAINSGAMVRTEFLFRLGGFTPNYRLDCVDRWLFRRIYSAKNTVAILPVDIQHNLSVLDYRGNISLERYRSILTAETRFALSEHSTLEAIAYVARLWVRAVKLLFLRNARMAFLTVSASANVFWKTVARRRELKPTRQHMPKA
jgi:GT2 family glycosyltransferase